jgi:hypothetical protein
MISEIIASGIQVIFRHFFQCFIIVIDCSLFVKPLQNLSVLKRIGDEKKSEWARHYIKVGLDGK